MTADAWTRQLSAQQRRLITAMRRLNFGEIRDLYVKDGQPVYEPPPQVVRVVKLGAENGPRPETQRDGATPKRRVLELIDELRRLDTGRVLRLGIKHGLPTDLTVEDSHDL